MDPVGAHLHHATWGAVGEATLRFPRPESLPLPPAALPFPDTFPENQPEAHKVPEDHTLWLQDPSDLA